MKLYHKIILLLFFLVLSMPAFAGNESDKFIISKMKEIYELEDANYEIEILSNKLKLPLISLDNLSIRALTQKEPLGLFTIIATIIVNDKVIETAQVRMRVKKYGEVLVASDRLKRHQKISAENTIVRKMEITNLREKPVLSIADTEGYRLKKNLRKGAILTSGAMEVIPDIESGMETTIVYDDGLCKITATGLALQSGVVGDYIKVKNKATKKIIIARIVNKRFVAISP